MIDVIRSIFGVYNPVTYSVGSDLIVPAGLAGVNMEYALQGLLFALCMFGVFRLFGVVLKGFR